MARYIERGDEDERSNFLKMVKAINALPLWEMADGERRTVWADMPCIKIFNPIGAATWFLCQREVCAHGYTTRMFGLCDLGLGYPELGWVGYTDLLTARNQWGQHMELDEWWDKALGDGYVEIGAEVPRFLIRAYEEVSDE